MKFEETPWGLMDPEEYIAENNVFVIAKDKYPVSKVGHQLYIPKKNDYASIAACVEAAVKTGDTLMTYLGVDGYNVGMNQGEAAGQTIPYPHVHLILREKGDTPNPIGGVRNVIEGKGDYTK